jgi:glycosyltransferase involved in cell wall biosynthesis
MLSLQKNRINLVVFFSYNISLKTWFNNKFINRELNLYNKLIKDDKFNIWFITYGDKSDLLYQKKLNNINIIPIYSNVDNNIFIKVFQFLFFPFKYYKILKKADIYKTNQLTGAPLAIFCNILFKKKLVIRVGWEPTYFYKSWGISYFKNIILTVNSLLAYNFGNYIILTTKEIKNFICRKYLFNTKKIIIIPNYVDTKLFNNRNKTKKKNTFLNISRLVHQKNLFDLLSIFSNSKFSIHIIGEGNLKKNLLNFAHINSVKLKIIRPVSNKILPNLISKYKMYITTSKIEGSPKVLLEVMSCELPVFATVAPGIDNFLSNKEGYIFKNTQDLKNAINNINFSNKNLKKKGRVARQKIISQFSFDKIYNIEKNFYYKILFKK